MSFSSSRFCSWRPKHEDLVHLTEQLQRGPLDGLHLSRRLISPCTQHNSIQKAFLQGTLVTMLTTPSSTDNDTHATTFKIKGNSSNVWKVWSDREQSHVSWLLSAFRLIIARYQFLAGLEIGIQVSPTKNWWIQFAMDIGWILQNDFILSQVPVLSGAQNINSPKVLDGVEVFDNDFFFAMMMEPLARLAVIIVNISESNQPPTLRAKTPRLQPVYICRPHWSQKEPTRHHH